MSVLMRPHTACIWTGSYAYARKKSGTRSIFSVALISFITASASGRISSSVNRCTAGMSAPSRDCALQPLAPDDPARGPDRHGGDERDPGQQRLHVQRRAGGQQVAAEVRGLQQQVGEDRALDGAGHAAAPGGAERREGGAGPGLRGPKPRRGPMMSAGGAWGKTIFVYSRHPRTPTARAVSISVAGA